MVYYDLAKYRQDFHENLFSDGRKLTQYLIAQKKEYETEIDNFSVEKICNENVEVWENCVAAYPEGVMLFAELPQDFFHEEFKTRLYHIIEPKTATEIYSLLNKRDFDEEDFEKIEQIIQLYLDDCYIKKLEALEEDKEEDLEDEEFIKLNDEISDYLEFYYLRENIFDYCEQNYKRRLEQIKDYITEKIDAELQRNEKEIIISEAEIEKPLTKTQKQVIGLLIESGIVEHLKQKFDANDNQIGKFIAEITKEQLQPKTVYNRIRNTDGSGNLKMHKDYAIQSIQDKQEAKLLLKTFFPNSANEE